MAHQTDHDGRAASEAALMSRAGGAPRSVPTALPARAVRSAGGAPLGLATWALVFLAASCGADEKRFVELSNRGVEALDSEDYDGAEAVFKDALKIRPADPDAHYYLGTIALRAGQFGNAAEQLRATIAADPGRPEAHVSLAKALYEDHHNKEALAALQELFKLDPGHPGGHLLAARIALGDRDRKGADEALRKSIAGDPGFVPAYQMLAQLYVEVGAFEAARKVLQEGLRFNADAVELREALGLVMLDLGRPDKAKEELKSAGSMPRARPQVYFNLASAELQLGNREAAIAALRSFIIQSQGVLASKDPLVQQAATMVLKLKGQE